MESKFGKELACVRAQYKSEPVLFTETPVVMHWPDAMDILEAKGFDVGMKRQIQSPSGSVADRQPYIVLK